MFEKPDNLELLVRRIAWAIKATEAAVFAVETDFFGKELKLLLHVRPDKSDAATRDAAVEAFKEIIGPCFQQAKDGAIEIVGTHDMSGMQYCLISLARREEEVVGAAAFIVRCRDIEDARTVLMRVQGEVSGL